ncbi:hypothetical protein ACTFIZ_004332 [Dictyostelium cf. discoideum]
MLFGLRVWVAKKITSIFDTTLISANVTFKTFFEELWQLTVQLANIVIVAVLGLFYKQGYQSYWEQKNRIKKKSSKKQTRRKPSPFLHLLNEQNEIDGYNTNNNNNNNNNNTSTTINSSSGASSPTLSPNLSSSSYRRSTSPLLKYSSSNTSLKKSPSLEQTPKYNYNNCTHSSHNTTTTTTTPKKSNKKFKKVNSFSRQDLVHQHEQITTGLLEDIRTNLLLFFDASFGWLRSTISSILAKISGFSIRSLFYVIFTFPFYLPYYIFYIISTPIILFNKFREFIKSIGEVKKLSNKIISGQELDIRTVKEIIEQSGYPYEKIHVTTDDGYILELERIPNKKSTNVLYLQHGIFDNSFAWIATGPAQSLAFAAYDQGYDVFLGNLRGNGDRLHQNSKISSKEYWNFSMSEHAFLDIPTFIQNIRKIKSKELFGLNNINTKVNLLNPNNFSTTSSSSSSVNNNKEQHQQQQQQQQQQQHHHHHYHHHYHHHHHPVDNINICAIAHSMGAAVLLMYIVRCRMLNKPHYISKAIVLSPAGYHKKAPKIVDILAPLINIWLYLYPIHVFRFPNESIKVIIAKIYHDAMSNLPTKNLLVYLVSRYLLGGDTRNHPLTTIHNLAYNTFNGTSVLIYRHFWQIRRSKKFEAYDYGPKKNLEFYGTNEPLNFLDHYNLIDIPIHFVMGLKDNLIDPVNIIKHYVTLKRYHPELAFLKASKNGHIEFTLGLDDQIRSYCLNVLEITPSTATPIIIPSSSSLNQSSSSSSSSSPSSPSSSPSTSSTHHIHSLSSTKLSGSVSNKLNVTSSNLDRFQSKFHH